MTTYVLLLNDMRERAENMTPVARASTKEALFAFLSREAVPAYQDRGDHTIIHDTDALAQAAGHAVAERLTGYCWNRSFRKGGPLEWFNPPWNDDESIRAIGPAEDCADMARQDWQNKIGFLPEVA